MPRQHLRRLIAVDRTGLVLAIVAVLGALIWGFPIYFSIFETLKPRGDAMSLSDWVVDVGRLGRARDLRDRPRPVVSELDRDLGGNPPWA